MKEFPATNNLQFGGKTSINWTLNRQNQKHKRPVLIEEKPDLNIHLENHRKI
jgi:hypothetical protein